MSIPTWIFAVMFVFAAGAAAALSLAVSRLLDRVERQERYIRYLLAGSNREQKKTPTAGTSRR